MAFAFALSFTCLIFSSGHCAGALLPKTHDSGCTEQSIDRERVREREKVARTRSVRRGVAVEGREIDEVNNERE
jgi:hypothetical protein